MSKSLIQTVNPSQQTVAENGIISLGSVIRRFGCNCRLSGNAIEVQGEGYYTVTAAVVTAPSTAGLVAVSLLKDGVQIPGASASATVAAADDFATLPLVATIRKGCNCDGASSITCLLNAGAGTVQNISMKVQKV